MTENFYLCSCRCEVELHKCLLNSERPVNFCTISLFTVFNRPLFLRFIAFLFLMAACLLTWCILLLFLYVNHLKRALQINFIITIIMIITFYYYHHYFIFIFSCLKTQLYKYKLTQFLNQYLIIRINLF